jgi:hypothetical protein
MFLIPFDILFHYWMWEIRPASFHCNKMIDIVAMGEQLADLIR